MEGWIKIHRKLLEWDWYDDANTKSMFLHLLLKANLKDKNWRGIEIKRGQLHTSISHLAIELGMSNKQVRICLEKLQKTNEIKTEGASNGTKVTVCKYDTYQQNENEEGQTRGQERGKRGANEGQQHKKDKNDNNNKNNNKELFDNFRKKFPGTRRGLDTEYEVLQKHTDYKEVIPLLIPALNKEIEHKLKLQKSGQFVPEWKNLKTWLNQRCWEQEFEEVSDSNKAIEELRGFYDQINNSKNEDKKSIIKYYTVFGNILKDTKHLKNASLSGFTPETLYQLLKKEDQFRMDEFRNLKSNIHKLDNENEKYLKPVLNKIIYYK